MRVLIDSNVLARATPGKNSAARAVLLLLIQAPHTLIASVPLFLELAQTLQYPRVRALHGLDDEGIQLFLQSLHTASAIVAPAIPAPFHSKDPDDDLIIASAIAGRAEVICTWDNDLLDPALQGAFARFGIRVLKDDELLHELRGLA